MKNALISILTIFTTILVSQDRSIIFNTSNPYFTCSDSGGNYTNYTCDDLCDSLNENDYCTILAEGFDIDINNTLANKFTVNEDYALEAFGVYLILNPQIEDLSLNHTATIKIHSDNSNSPGQTLGEWTIDVSTGFYHNMYVGDGCIDLDRGSDYWISAHVDYSHTELLWLYTQYPFYTYAQTDNDGATWESSQYGTAGAAAIWAEQIFYTDWQPAQTSADVNLDGSTNVLDVVQLVQYVLGNISLTEEGLKNSDFNQDDTVNILDVVSIVNLVLNNGEIEPMPSFSLEDINPASDYYGDYIGPEIFRGDVSLYYFGKAG